MSVVEAEAEASYVAGFPVPLPLPPGGMPSVLHAASSLWRAYPSSVTLITAHHLRAAQQIVPTNCLIAAEVIAAGCGHIYGSPPGPL